jgi:hypothetical protein
MNARGLYHSDNFSSKTLECAWFRWGGGADHGCYHVFIAGFSSSDLFPFSLQCVVDDFGTLVRAGSAA